MAKFKVLKKQAKKISYDSAKKRNRNDVKYIVIHYTAGKNDTAKNEADYFANSNTREAGAHFFVDREGIIYRSIPMNRTAWAVGGAKYSNCGSTGGGSYYGKCTNYNSVSIELCAIADKEPSKKQTEATKWLIDNYIKKYCKKADTIIRHFDVTGKECPARMTGKNNKEWKAFKKAISE